MTLGLPEAVGAGSEGEPDTEQDLQQVDDGGEQGRGPQLCRVGRAQRNPPTRPRRSEGHALSCPLLGSAATAERGPPGTVVDFRSPIFMRTRCAGMVRRRCRRRPPAGGLTMPVQHGQDSLRPCHPCRVCRGAKPLDGVTNVQIRNPKRVQGFLPAEGLGVSPISPFSPSPMSGGSQGVDET